MKDILVDRSPSGVVTVTLNRPHHRNAVTFSMWGEMQRIFQDVSNSSTDRVLVITGTAPAFCSGADLGADLPAMHPLQSMGPVNAAANALHEVTKPSIAKVNGDAVGAGMNLALGCDLIVAGESARFSEIFVRRGLSVDFGGTWLLPRLIGMHKAKQLALFGDVISARDAERMGIVNRVVADDELDDFTDDWAQRLAAGPPLAMQQTKKMLSNAFSQSLSEALDAEASAQTVNIVSEDTREGIRAFLEKRAPKFEGR